MQLYGYIRVSTDDQADSLALQDKLISQYCDMYGHDLVDVFVDENVSGGTPLEKRAGGAALCDALRDGGADGMIMKELDRAFRLTVDGLLTADFFNKQGWEIHAVYDRVDTSTPDGWAALAHKLVMGEWERRKIQHRTRGALRARRESGRAFGPTPYGLVKVSSDDNTLKALYKDPATWGVREWIIDSRKELSLDRIARDLMDMNVPNPSGGHRWHKSTLKVIIDTHHGLEHIPFLDDEHDTVVSIDNFARKSA